MKQKDIALIILIVCLSGAASFFLTNMLIVSSSSRQAAPVVDIINSDFTQPDTRYFNSSSIDPTQLIHIGVSSNSNPFSAQ